MYKVGVFPGKFFPPHRGHLSSIIRAATQVERLYVVVSDNMQIANLVCKEHHLPPMPLELRARWMSVELQGLDHIKVLTLDETGIPPYPEGTEPWSKKLKETVPEAFEVIFGGEVEYQNTYMKNFPGVAYEVHDYNRTKFNIHATEIRLNYLNHWDYILGAARGFFARRVLITGVESCGKSILTKYLGKLFYTSWSEEWGRYYPEKYIGGNDQFLVVEDFHKIAHDQWMIDEETLRTANRIAFFDTDAVVTQFYCEMYIGKQNKLIETYVDPKKYDVVLMLSPTVKWVPDGMRWNSSQRKRESLQEHLLTMYKDRGFKRIITITHEKYLDRLNEAVGISERLITDRLYMSRF